MEAVAEVYTQGEGFLPEMEIVVSEGVMEEIKEKNLQVFDPGKPLLIQTPLEYQAAIERKKAIRVRMGEVKKLFEPAKKAQHEAHRRIVELEKKALEPLEQGDRVLDQGLLAYTNEQRRQAEEHRRQVEAEQRRREEEARRQAEEERARVALELAAQGKIEEAAEVAAMPAEAIVETVFVPAPVVDSQAFVPKVKGYSVQEKYRAEVVDLKALVVAVAEGKAPLASVLANESFLNKQASALKQEFNFPGVKLVTELKSATRAKGGF